METGSTTLAKTQLRLLFSVWVWFLLLARPMPVCLDPSVCKKSMACQTWRILPPSPFV
ncbi:hypothetical protein E4T44_14148 [Aureobasidium sp. EXF-8845]|nr:hypothetical protein E4T44_14148 [Aureobasidium sp. EXF-8845]KAI4785342.1 hypothetical protein E4T45_14023 [Aureobasidium sp. EXF-8846]